MRMTLLQTSKHLPAFWENGGGMTTTGNATVIGGNHGQKKTAVFENTHGNLACKDHALFVVHIGDTIVGVNREHNKSVVVVTKVVDVGLDPEDPTKAWADLKQAHLFSDGKWDEKPPRELDDIIEAAMNKSTCYHCREMHYGKVGRPFSGLSTEE